MKTRIQKIMIALGLVHGLVGAGALAYGISTVLNLRTMKPTGLQDHDAELSAAFFGAIAVVFIALGAIAAVLSLACVLAVRGMRRSPELRSGAWVAFGFASLGVLLYLIVIGSIFWPRQRNVRTDTPSHDRQ